MATVAGKDADITVADYDANCHAWSLDIVADPLEDTNWDDSGVGQAQEGWRTNKAGLKGFSGSFECRADSVPATSLLPGTDVATAKFYVDVATTFGYSGSIIITAVHPGATIDGLETLTVDFVGDGALSVGDIS